MVGFCFKLLRRDGPAQPIFLNVILGEYHSIRQVRVSIPSQRRGASNSSLLSYFYDSDRECYTHPLTYDSTMQLDSGLAQSEPYQ